jgi:hypothetical protein
LRGPMKGYQFLQSISPFRYTDYEIISILNF